jgi:hypothetical protein
MALLSHILPDLQEEAVRILDARLSAKPSTEDGDKWATNPKASE